MSEQIVVTKKGFTPDEDFERMAENLWTNMGDVIEDRDTFDSAYDDYFQTQLTPKRGRPGIRDRVWDWVQTNYGDRLKDSSGLHKKAGGKNLELDKKRLHKRVVVSPQEYVRLGARHADLANYDTPKDYVFLGKQRRKETQRKRAVFSRVINTKAGLRFIDKKGRYVSYTFKA